jgi:hypothetical protein
MHGKTKQNKGKKPGCRKLACSNIRPTFKEIMVQTLPV